jgi:large subunit ribosomal protein L3
MASSTSEKPTGQKTATKSLKPRRALLGRKIGMTQVYSETGQWVPVTVIKAGPCTVLQIKTVEKDGYAAIQVGFDDTKKKQKNPQQAQLDRIGIPAKRFVHEIPLVDEKDLSAGPERNPQRSPDRSSVEPPQGSDEAGAAPRPPPKAASEKEAASEKGGGSGKKKEKKPPAPLDPRVGSTIGVAIFKEIARVDVRGVTKGRGFTGVIRRHHFNAGPKSHGTKNIREPKSTGMHTDPGRVHRGKRMPGHLGAAYRKARNLDVIKLVEDDNLLLVKGSIPGPNGGYVYIQESLR